MKRSTGLPSRSPGSFYLISFSRLPPSAENPRKGVMRGVFRFPLPILEICHISFELVANFEVTYLDVVQGDIPEQT